MNTTVTLNIIRGNSSETFVWSIAERLRQIEKPIFIYYLGDHDPNGLDIERDMHQRLNKFVGCDWATFVLEFCLGGEIHWQRLAITSEEFSERRDLTGFPVRMATKAHGWRTRCQRYIAEHGDKCIEIDALPPNEIRQRLREAVESHIDQAEWQRLKKNEALEREAITTIFSKLSKRAA